MKKVLLLDFGSLTVKTYQWDGNVLVHLINFSLNFKEGFTPEDGLSLENKTKLFEFVKSLKLKYQNTPIKTFATAIYRKLTPEAKVKFVDEFFIETGIYFNIVPHDLENFYLEMALVDKCKLNEPVLLINIGGGSTELVVMKGLSAIERHNIEIGVGTVNSEFPNINQEFSDTSLDKILEYVKQKLPELENKVKVAFYSGGELTYMGLAGYDLEDNNLFEDNDHPFLIRTSDFGNKNKEVFSEISLKDLEELMPENPTWMHGARGCSAIAQAICEKYGVEVIVPSDTDLIHGVAKQELRSVTISGSFRKHLPQIIQLKKTLEAQKVEILSPRFTEPKNPGEEFVVFSGEENQSPLQLEEHHLEAIKNSDALVVCDPAGYVGASALIEIGYAKCLGKKIIYTEKPEEFMLNTLPAEIMN